MWLSVDPSICVAATMTNSQIISARLQDHTFSDLPSIRRLWLPLLWEEQLFICSDTSAYKLILDEIYMIPWT